jgi:hypothetical protein
MTRSSTQHRNNFRRWPRPMVWVLEDRILPGDTLAGFALTLLGILPQGVSWSSSSLIGDDPSALAAVPANPADGLALNPAATPAYALSDIAWSSPDQALAAASLLANYPNLLAAGSPSFGSPDSTQGSSQAADALFAGAAVDPTWDPNVILAAIPTLAGITGGQSTAGGSSPSDGGGGSSAAGVVSSGAAANPIGPIANSGFSASGTLASGAGLGTSSTVTTAADPVAGQPQQSPSDSTSSPTSSLVTTPAPLVQTGPGGGQISLLLPPTAPAEAATFSTPSGDLVTLSSPGHPLTNIQVAPASADPASGARLPWGQFSFAITNVGPDGTAVVPLTETDVTFSRKTSRGNASSLTAGVPAESEASCPTTFLSLTPWRQRRPAAQRRRRTARFRAASTSAVKRLRQLPTTHPLRRRAA